MSQKPYFSVPREVFEMPFFRNRVFTKGEALINLYSLANWANGEIEVRGIYVPVLIGQVGWSFKSLAKKWGWSTSKVKLFLDKLKSESQIETQNSNVTTIITMKHYIHPKENESQIDTQKSRRRVAEESQKIPIYNKEKELTERKEEYTGIPVFPELLKLLPEPVRALHDIPGWIFDVIPDGTYLLGLVNEFPEIDEMKLLANWKTFIEKTPFKPNSDQRAQLRSQFENARTYGMHKKTPGNGNNGDSKPLSDTEAVHNGTFDYEKASEA